MLHAIDGQALAGAVRAVPGDAERDKVYKRQTAQDMKTRFLKARLCSAGPKMCDTCGLCEYGKEYARRAREGEKQ